MFFTVIHELDASLEIVEDNRLVDVGLGDRPDLNYALGDNAEVALMA